MAGYLWQASEACRRCLTEPPDTLIRIEIDDDLSVATANDRILWCCEQLKHSEYEQSISEESPLWWKAIDAWIRGQVLDTPKLRLVTTSALQPDSLLASCYQPLDAAPWEALLDVMDKRAKDAPNQKLKNNGVYHSWTDLSTQDRRKLLTRIEIANSQGRLEVANEAIEKILMEQRAVSPSIVARVRESFVGAFMARLMGTLDSGGFEVSAHEMNQEFLDAYARHATPGFYEFPDMEYSDDDIKALQDEHHQHLIPQLAAIERDHPETIARALDNWFRARVRRQDFMDGAPHEIHDLQLHDKNLRGYCITIHEEHDHPVDTKHSKTVGQKVYAECMKHQSKLGRTDPPLDFTQGSYHELSNNLHVKWNPTYGEE